GSVEVQTAQWQPSVGTPTLVPEPSTVIFSGAAIQAFAWAAALARSSETCTKRKRSSVREFSSSRCSSRLRLPLVFSVSTPSMSMAWRARSRSGFRFSSSPYGISPRCTSACVRKENTRNVNEAGGRGMRTSSCGFGLFSVSLIKCILPVQFRLQRRLHAGPFGFDHAEVNRVAVAAVGVDHVIAQRAFLAGADARDGAARRLVAGVGFQLDADAPQRFESMAQHQVLGLRVDARALPRRGDECPPDFDLSVGGVDVAVARAAHHAPGGYIDHGERDGSPAPERRIESNLAQPRVVLERQRLQPDLFTRQSNRRKGHSNILRW